MKFVAVLTDPKDLDAAVATRPDLIELRLDWWQGDLVEITGEIRRRTGIPLIATLRSRGEGGTFQGGPEEWYGIIRPLLSLVDLVDIERRFRSHAAAIRKEGKTVIASCHCNFMPDAAHLTRLEEELRSFGDMPKIVVTPATRRDIIELLAFTDAADPPVCTGVCGAAFRSARLLLPLFGSEFSYCSIGAPSAKGQYALSEFRDIISKLR